MEITRVKFKDSEAQGARNRPAEIQSLSVHCDISPLVLNSGSKEVTKVLVHCFFQIATTSWNSMWEHWLPDFQWCPVRGGLYCNEKFEKAVAEIQHDTYHYRDCHLWMLLQGELGRNNAGFRAARASSLSSGSSSARSSKSSSPAQVRTRVVAYIQAEALSHVVPN